jgi:hypothetical protein
VSFSFQVANGDLVLAGDSFAIVYGQNKLTQDLTLWLAERYGIDRFHPMMGSQFQNYIGGIIGYNTQSMVYGEALRVLDNYQKVQFNAFQQNPQNFAMAELLYNIDSVDVSITYDTVAVAIAITNGASQASSVTVSQGTT